MNSHYRYTDRYIDGHQAIFNASRRCDCLTPSPPQDGGYSNRTLKGTTPNKQTADTKIAIVEVSPYTDVLYWRGLISHEESDRTGQDRTGRLFCHHTTTKKKQILHTWHLHSQPRSYISRSGRDTTYTATTTSTIILIHLLTFHLAYSKKFAKKKKKLSWMNQESSERRRISVFNRIFMDNNVFFQKMNLNLKLKSGNLGGYVLLAGEACPATVWPTPVLKHKEALTPLG